VPLPAAAAEPAVAATPSQQVAISWDGTTETIDIELDPSSEVTGFIFPTPSKPTVTTGEPALFDALESATAPVRMVEDDWWGRRQADLGTTAPTVTTDPVEIDPTVVKATDTKALEKWLTTNDFELTDATAEALTSYAKDGWSFTLLSLDKSAAHTPIHLEFEATRPVYPLRLAVANESTTTYRMYVFGEGRTDFRQLPRTRREIDAARTTVWAGSVAGTRLGQYGDYLTVTDLRIDDPATQVTTDIAIIDARGNDELIPSVVVYRPIQLLGFPLGWLIVVWGGIGALVGVGYLANRFRAK
jgi:hypothetical protein